MPPAASVRGKGGSDPASPAPISHTDHDGRMCLADGGKGLIDGLPIDERTRPIMHKDFFRILRKTGKSILHRLGARRSARCEADRDMMLDPFQYVSKNRLFLDPCDDDELFQKAALKDMP